MFISTLCLSYAVASAAALLLHWPDASMHNGNCSTISTSSGDCPGMRALRGIQSLIRSLQGEASRTFRLPRDTLAARSFVEHIDEADRFLATPSILQLPSGRILVLFEKCALWVTALHPAAALCPPLVLLVLLGTLGEFRTRQMLREPAHAQS